jgi:uncharacterized protein (DUF1499 family)
MAESAKSWWARAMLIGSVVALVLLVLGPVGTRLGIWGFQTGLLVLIPASVLLATIGLLVGVVSIFVSKKRGFTTDLPVLFVGIGICGVIVAVMFVQFLKGTSVPPIHNISTDVTDPPQFSAVVALRGEGTNPLTYDAVELGPQQQAAYPEVKSLTVAGTIAEVVPRVVSALEAMGLEIVAVDAGSGIVEATDTTFWFGFKDDMVVRVRASNGASVVDARSVSRVGVSDLGANAARITDLLGRLGAST